MKIFLVITILMSVTLTGRAQDADSDFNEMLQSGAQWAQDNLDQDELTNVCREVESRLKGNSVRDLADLQQLVTALLPVLDKYEETQPYAAWLRSRLDYLTVAKQFQSIPPLPESILVPSNPSPQEQRDAWQKQFVERPLLPRAREYVPVLKKAFAAEGVPVELVWLAEVESSFDPRAQSPVGAAGLFQLMPATAEYLGLKLRPRDQRLQPEASARAAAKYLRYLHGKFKDWRLALAAYNAGEGRVRALMEKHRASTFDKIATALPAETQLYVPKVEAVVRRREGVKLESLKFSNSPKSERQDAAPHTVISLG
jgi:membrane-bound lytic murein transglycosylase D